MTVTDLCLKGYERVNDSIKNAIEKIGETVSVSTSEGTTVGTAVLYPVRYDKNLFGGTNNNAEGRSDPAGYMMFCNSKLLRNAGYGDKVFGENHHFTIIWVDEYDSRVGSYIKACLRRIELLNDE